MRRWLRRTLRLALDGKGASGNVCELYGPLRAGLIVRRTTLVVVPLVSHNYSKRQAPTPLSKSLRDCDTSNIVIQVPAERWQSGRGRGREAILGTKL